MQHLKHNFLKGGSFLVLSCLLVITHYTAYYWGVYSHPTESQIRDAATDLYANKPIRMSSEARKKFDENLKRKGPISNIERMDVGWKWYGDTLTVRVLGSRKGEGVGEVITFDAMGAVIGFHVLW